MMTAKQQELLSAFVDGELNKHEIDELLMLMQKDSSAKEAFMRFQFSSDVIHGYKKQSKLVDLTPRISSALADEAPHNIESGNTKKSNVLTLPGWFWKQTAGLAAAASIGALAVVGVMNQPQTTMTPQLAEVNVVSQQETTLATAADNRWTVGEREVEDRLNNYLVDHNEYAGASGLFSYARVVSYGEE
ncbi:sigma-E factor negative regulatory protein [Methylophaga sp.]|uniref:sigma-E factor negative regulatory protein n=1 Tax=Methylophaga sp. TaxID=2024840 RepID=UPI003F6970FF